MLPGNTVRSLQGTKDDPPKRSCARRLRVVGWKAPARVKHVQIQPHFQEKCYLIVCSYWLLSTLMSFSIFVYLLYSLVCLLTPNTCKLASNSSKSGKSVCLCFFCLNSGQLSTHRSLWFSLIFPSPLCKIMFMKWNPFPLQVQSAFNEHRHSTM